MLARGGALGFRLFWPLEMYLSYQCDLTYDKEGFPVSFDLGSYLIHTKALSGMSSELRMAR